MSMQDHARIAVLEVTVRDQAKEIEELRRMISDLAKVISAQPAQRPTLTAKK